MKITNQTSKLILILLFVIGCVIGGVIGWTVSAEGGARGRLIDLVNAAGSGCVYALEVEELDSRKEIPEADARVWIVKFTESQNVKHCVTYEAEQ